MQTREIVGLTLIPIALLITSATVSAAGVGSVLWFCGLLATGILLLALVGFSYNLSPASIPVRTCWIVFLVSVAILGVGTIIRIVFHQEIDRLQHRFWGPGQRESNIAFVVVSELYHWLSFSGVLFCVFFAPRLFGTNTQPNPTNVPSSPPDQSSDN